MSVFGGLLRAREGMFAQDLERQALMERLEEMVRSGKVDASVLESAKGRQSGSHFGLPRITKKDVQVFEYIKGVTPVPRSIKSGEMHGTGLGTRVSMGRMRWVSEGVSIFSVADGKKMANTQPKALNHYDSIRMNKIQKAALETPTVFGGLRVLPEMTPGRALMWGTIVALWGTGALVASTAKYLEIESMQDVPGRMKEVLTPLGKGLKSQFLYWFSGGDMTGIQGQSGLADDSMVMMFASKLKMSFEK